WAAAGLAGPIFTSWVYETTQSYTNTMMVFSGMFVVALIISLLIRLDIKKLQEEAKRKENSVDIAS
ncbi:MFS transporter, partial [Bacillus amyloliquefaciens]